MQSFNSIISTATPQFKYTDYYGFEINILVELARVLNFTYTIENPPDGKKNVRIYLLQNVISFEYYGFFKQIIVLVSKENGDMWRQMVPGQV